MGNKMLLTNHKRLKVFLIMLSFLLIPISFRQLFAAPFYERKVLRIVVGSDPGGGYDRMARIVAQFLPKHIPGKPTVIVENMPGAGSVVAANYLFSVAKPDGLTIGTFERGLPIAQLLKTEGVRFDSMKYSWIGSANVEATVLAIRSDLPYKTFEDLRKSNQLIHLSCGGIATLGYQFPILLKEFLGLKLNIISYGSSPMASLAVERKEADGKAASYSSVLPAIESGLLRLVIRGRVSESGIENLPVDEDLAADVKAKTIMAMRSAPDMIGRPYVAPPGTPPEVMKILRDAFAKFSNDPECKALAKRSMMTVNYVPAEEATKTLQYLLNQPENIIKEFSRYIKF